MFLRLREARELPEEHDVLSRKGLIGVAGFVVRK